MFEITGTDRKIALFELANRAKQLGDSLDAKSSFDAAPSFSNGVHIAEVEIDPPPGATTLANPPEYRPAEYAVLINWSR